MKVKLKKQQESDVGKVYILLNFEGGDADTTHPDVVLMENFSFDGKQEIELPFETTVLIEKYKILKNILDVNHKDYLENYKKVKEKYGEEMADLYDDVPNDPQTDYSCKCYLSDIQLKAYDLKGALYVGYL